MIYRIFVNNKIVSTQYTQNAVSTYLKQNHGNIRGIGVRTIRRNMVDGIYERGILRIEEVRDTQNIRQRKIKKRIFR